MLRSLLVPAFVLAALLIQGCGIKGPLQPPSDPPPRKLQAAPAP